MRIGILQLLFIILLTLKVFGIGELSWVQVFIPIYIYLGIFVVVLVAYLIIGEERFEKMIEKGRKKV